MKSEGQEASMNNASKFNKKKELQPIFSIL